MNILTVTHYFATNGAGVESIAGRLNELLRARGHDVRWIASHAMNRVTRSFPQGESEIGIRSWDGIREATDLAFPVFGPWSLPRIVREVRRCDVVHLHEAFYPLQQAVLWIAFLLRRPVVITQHIADMPIRGMLRGNAVRLANLVMTRPAFAVAQRIVYETRRTQRHFESWSRNKDVFIPNGCDAELFRPATPDEVIATRRALDLPAEGMLALFAGRFIEKKGLHHVREVALKHPEVNFVLIGSGPVEPRVWNAPNVTVRNPVPLHELRQFYWAADVLVLPSVGEGLPLVVQEASCCGVAPMISTEIVEAAPELKPFAFDAGPGGTRLAAAFDSFLGLGGAQSRRHDLAALARSLWSWQRCGDTYVEVLASAVARRAPSIAPLRPPSDATAQSPSDLRA
jgi:glycosyltransferase involved in cell wall biosynthesis